MSSPPPPQPTMPPPQAGRERKPWIIPVVVTVIAVVIAVAIAAAVIFALGGFSQRGPAEIVSVTHSPQNPSPGQDITITVESKNASDCSLHTISYFKDGPSGGSTAATCGPSHWEVNIGSFGEGTEVWYVASVVGTDGNMVISQNYTVQVGDVERSSITTLRIQDVHQYPQNPSRSDSVVNLMVEVASNATIDKVEFGFVVFANQAGGTGCGFMTAAFGSNYSAVIDLFRYIGHLSDYECTVLYRIAAMDASGNTALSEVFSFTVS